MQSVSVGYDQRHISTEKLAFELLIVQCKYVDAFASCVTFSSEKSIQ